MDILYRKATPEDARALLEYLETVGGESDNLTFGAEGLPFCVEDEETYLSGLENDPSSLMLLAMEGTRIIGNAAVTGSDRPRIAHLRELSISYGKVIGAVGLAAA